MPDVPDDVPPSCESWRGGLASTFAVFSRLSTKTVVAVAAFGLAIDVAIGWRIGLTAALPAYLFIGAVGWIVALIDAFERRIPNVVILPSYPISLALLVVASAAEDRWYGLVRGAVGMLVLGGFYLLLALIRPGELGFGDVKLAGLLGLALGWLGWRTLILGSFLGPALAAIAAFGLVLARRRVGRTSLPFGPFLVAGALVALLLR